MTTLGPDAVMLEVAGRYQVDLNPQQGSAIAADGFTNYLESALDHVNQFHVNADNKVEDFLTGKNVPVHDVMIELSKADTAMRLATTVISKALDAYNEISRMSV